MRVAYFCCHAAHLPLGALSVASVKKHMPQVETVQLTDAATPAIDGVDTVLRIELRGHFWRRHWLAYAELGTGDVICANTDVVFRDDVSHVFKDGYFSIAVPTIRDPHFRYDAGVLFSRSPSFCAALADAPVGDDLNAWLASYQSEIDSGRHRVMRIPGKVYSYVPSSAGDRCDGAKVAHYRGPRKQWMHPDWQQVGEAQRWNAAAA